MGEQPADAASVEHALAGGSPQNVGWFRFYFADQRREWSPQVEHMHGYEPGAVTPTTELVLSHKHPDDYGQVAATLEEIRLKPEAFSNRHRIVAEAYTEAIAELAESRGVIEQAKGMLMLGYRISADAAFELLKWRSQETNVKVRALAAQIAIDFIELNSHEELTRKQFDEVLLTSHQRIST